MSVLTWSEHQDSHNDHGCQHGNYQHRDPNSFPVARWRVGGPQALSRVKKEDSQLVQVNLLSSRHISYEVVNGVNWAVCPDASMDNEIRADPFSLVKNTIFGRGLKKICLISLVIFSYVQFFEGENKAMVHLLLMPMGASIFSLILGLRTWQPVQVGGDGEQQEKEGRERGFPLSSNSLQVLPRTSWILNISTSTMIDEQLSRYLPLPLQSFYLIFPLLVDLR